MLRSHHDPHALGIEAHGIVTEEGSDVAIVAGALSSGAADKLNGREEFTNAPESQQGFDLIEVHLGAENFQEQIVFTPTR